MTPPQIKDYEGKWDEYLAGFIVAVPFILILLGGTLAIAFGYIEIDTITFEGDINVAYFAYGIGGLLGATWLLAVMKIFGVKPVIWLANIADSYRKNE